MVVVAVVVGMVVLWEEEGGMRSAGWMGTRMDASTLSRTGRVVTAVVAAVAATVGDWSCGCCCGGGDGLLMMCVWL